MIFGAFHQKYICCNPQQLDIDMKVQIVFVELTLQEIPACICSCNPSTAISTLSLVRTVASLQKDTSHTAPKIELFLLVDISVLYYNIMYNGR